MAGQAGHCLRGRNLEVLELIQSFDGFALSWPRNGELGKAFALSRPQALSVGEPEVDRVNSLLLAALLGIARDYPHLGLFEVFAEDTLPVSFFLQTLQQLFDPPKKPKPLARYHP